MPFIKSASGEVKWEPPTSEDIVRTRKEIVGEEVRSPVDQELTQTLRDKIEEATRYLVSSNRGIIPFANRNVYSSIRTIVSSAPGLVDIILPVFNSIHIAQQCIEKVLERTVWPYRLYIVDDASDAYTKRKLAKFAERYPDKITLLTNRKNKGFAASVNSGIKAGNGAYICLLNSDVLVTPLWLTKMVLALKAEPRNQIVCPATNNTALVDIPLAQGASYLAMNHVFEKFAIRNYPELLPTGFCFLFPRSLTEKIGLFDEAYVSYGEETQFWWNTVTYTDGSYYPRFRAVMADDAYVFHERGSSFSSLSAEEHMGLRKVASGKFNEQNPNWKLWQKTYDVKRTIGYLRNPVPAQLINDRRVEYRIAWVVHDTQRCGGMHYIADVVNALIERNVDAKVCLIKRRPEQTTSYLGELRTAPVIFESYEDFVNTFQVKVFKKGLVVAATVELSGVVRALGDAFPDLMPILHCQSYEPDLVDDSGVREKIKQAFHFIPNVVTNSRWISAEIQNEYGITPFATVNPGVDVDVFYPRDRGLGDDRLTIMIPVSPMPYRGYARVIELVPALEREASARGIDLRILLTGIKTNPIKASGAIALGPLPPVRIAHLLGTEVDLFVEPSLNHSYGMPALEAMACGVPVVSWDNKGIHEYGKSGENCLIIDSTNWGASAAPEILTLLQDQERRVELARTALAVRETHAREPLTRQLIEEFEKRFNLRITPRRIVMVVPHLRKHGGPTTLLSLANQLAHHGHNVSILTLYADVNPEVTKTTDLPIEIHGGSIPKCDVAIVNSDNPLCAAVAGAGHIKRKIMLKLSHNPRFKQLEEAGLTQPWDAVVTSSEWLKQVTENPTPGWNYSGRRAVKIGWWHYGHETFEKSPGERVYGDGETRPITIATLIHQHPSKGSSDAVAVLGRVFEKYQKKVQFVGIGEVDPNKFQTSLPSFLYRFAPNREDLAAIFQQTDIWLGASHTEGLGRMALEAMSAGAVPVLSDTGAEFAQDGTNCLLFPVGGVDSAYEHLCRLIDDAGLRANLQTNAFRTAKKAAEPGACMDALESVIRRLF